MEPLYLPGGIQLYSYRDTRFKQGALSIQFIRRMDKAEAAANALIPAVLLRGAADYPDLRAITLRLDDLYGASVSALVRRVGDYQTTGFYCNFMEDRFALDGDAILAPMMEFVGSLLTDPVMENGCFSTDFVESEKKNLVSTIESEINDKRAYASAKLMKLMCKGDSFGLPRLGEKEDVEKLTAQGLYAHYRKVLEESPVQVFYVGSAEPEYVAQLLKTQFEKIPRKPLALAPQRAICPGQECHEAEKMDISQAKLCMGFVTSVTNRDADFAAMQVLNVAYGGGMTSKLFMNVREKLSLCYSVSSSYFGTKGLMTVSAGIDADKEQVAREEILAQLDACRRGEITQEELDAAKNAVLSSLETIHDSPGAIEGYYSTAVLSGLGMSPEEYARAVSGVTAQDVSRVAKLVQYHSSFIVKNSD